MQYFDGDHGIPIIEPRIVIRPLVGELFEIQAANLPPERVATMLLNAYRALVRVEIKNHHCANSKCRFVPLHRVILRKVDDTLKANDKFAVEEKPI